MKENQIEPKQKILNTAISLFAQKGHSAVGIREIAREANVNISMISYYFEGKIGMLKMILNQFHDQYNQIFSDIKAVECSSEELVRQVVEKVISFIRTHTELTLVAFNVLPLDIPEIEDLKAQRVAELTRLSENLFKRFNLDITDPILMSVIGPALISIVLNHFRYQAVQKRVLNIDFDDSFYDKFIEMVTIFFLKGLTGIAEQKIKTKGDGYNENHG